MIGLEIGIALGVLILSGVGKMLWDKYTSIREDLKELVVKINETQDKTHDNAKDIEYLRRDMETHTNTTNRIFEVLDQIQKTISNIEKLLAKNQIS